MAFSRYSIYFSSIVLSVSFSYSNCKYYTFEMFHWLKQSSILQPFGFPSLTSNHSVSYITNSNKVSMIYYESQVPPCASVPHHRKQSTTSSVLRGHWPWLATPQNRPCIRQHHSGTDMAISLLHFTALLQGEDNSINRGENHYKSGHV